MEFLPDLLRLSWLAFALTATLHILWPVPVIGPSPGLVVVGALRTGSAATRLPAGRAAPV
jgi:hypothetical protein